MDHQTERRSKLTTKTRKEHPKARQVIALSDKGFKRSQIAAETGVPARQVRHIIEEENIKRTAQAKIDPDKLSLTAQQKLGASIKQAACTRAGIRAAHPGGSASSPGSDNPAALQENL